MRSTEICDDKCTLEVDIGIGGGNDNKIKKMLCKNVKCNNGHLNCFTAYVVTQTWKQL